MEMVNNRHARALQIADEKIRRSPVMKYARELYIYGSYARGHVKWDSDIDLFLVLDPSAHQDMNIKKDIIFLKGNLAEEDLDAPEIDLKVVFGDAWKDCNQIYYKNIKREGKMLWKMN